MATENSNSLVFVKTTQVKLCFLKKNKLGGRYYYLKNIIYILLIIIGEGVSGA